MANNISDSVVRGFLWLFMVCVMLASFRHTAAGFGSFEEKDWQWWGAIPAVAIDGGLLVVTYAISQRRQRGLPDNGKLWAGFAVFLVVGSYANLTHAVMIASGTESLLGVKWETIWTLDIWQLAGVALYGGILSGLAALLTEANGVIGEGTSAPLPHQGEQAATTKNTQVLVENLPTTRQPTDDNDPQVKQLLPPRYHRTLARQRIKRRNGHIADSMYEGPMLAASDLVKVAAEVVEQPRQQEQDLVILDDELQQAVICYARLGSYTKAGKALGLTGEGVRQRVCKARKLSPGWVANQLGTRE